MGGGVGAIVSFLIGAGRAPQRYGCWASRWVRCLVVVGLVGASILVGRLVGALVITVGVHGASQRAFKWG